MLQYLQFVLLLTQMPLVSPFHDEDAGQRLSSLKRNMLFKGDKILHDTESPNSSTICGTVFDTKLILRLLTRSFTEITILLSRYQDLLAPLFYSSFTFVFC